VRNLFFDGFRPDVRDFMGAQRHIDGHAGAHVVAKHFHYLADSFGAAGRALGQFDDHHITHAGAHHLFRRDQDIEAQTAVVRHDEADARVGEIASDNIALLGHEHAHNARFAAAFTV